MCAISGYNRKHIFNNFSHSFQFVVNFFLISDWNWYGLLVQGLSPTQAWRNQYYCETWMSLATFLAVDSVWVTWVPSCVRSPSIILTHHAVALFYLLGPIYYPELRWIMGACISVEINTWFLILRRLVYQAKIKSAATSSKSLSFFCIKAFAELVSFFFYISWVVTRLYTYPAVLCIFLKLAVEEADAPLLFIPLHCMLCVLYFKWSYDLFAPMVTKWAQWGRYQQPRVDHLITSGF
jgi:hypothetical protein